jgi:hypothetical protein
VDSFAVLNVKALMYIDKIAKLHPQVVASHFVDLDPPFLDVIGA